MRVCAANCVFLHALGCERECVCVVFALYKLLSNARMYTKKRKSKLNIRIRIRVIYIN